MVFSQTDVPTKFLGKYSHRQHPTDGQPKMSIGKLKHSYKQTKFLLETVPTDICFWECMPTESVVDTVTQCFLTLEAFSQTQNTTKFKIGRCSHRQTAKKRFLIRLLLSQTDVPIKFYRKLFSQTIHKPFPQMNNVFKWKRSYKETEKVFMGKRSYRQTDRQTKLFKESVPTDK